MKEQQVAQRKLVMMLEKGRSIIIKESVQMSTVMWCPQIENRTKLKIGTK